MVDERGAGKTICPSEVARGEIAVTQRGRPVDARTAHGPIRLGPP